MDIFTKEKRSWNMSRIKSKDTTPEINIRKYLFKKGYRYRINYKIPGKPDIVFPKKKLAVFIHGCFWHYHKCKNSTLPKSNVLFWKNKLESNVARDKFIVKELKKGGWKIFIIWECEIEGKVRGKKLNRLLKIIKKR